MKIFLTGACGYVGSALLPALRDAGHEVSAIDLQWFYQDTTVGVQDVREVKALPKGTDIVIHLAAIANDPSVAFYPRRSWETGVLATQQLAQCAIKIGARFIYASSVSVYGADRGLVTEDMDVHPLSDYNKTKMCAERVLLSYPGLYPQIIRPATICGVAPRMRLDLTVNLFTMQALTKGKITVHGGMQKRPSIHIDDMVGVYLWMIDHPEYHGIYNAGFENNSLEQIANEVMQMTQTNIHITQQRDIRSYEVCSDKLLATGFKPKYTIQDAIELLEMRYHAGLLEDKPQHYNLGWMESQGIKDE